MSDQAEGNQKICATLRIHILVSSLVILRRRFSTFIVARRGSGGIPCAPETVGKPKQLGLRRGSLVPAAGRVKVQTHRFVAALLLINTPGLSLRRRRADCGNPRRTPDGSPGCASRDERGWNSIAQRPGDRDESPLPPGASHHAKFSAAISSLSGAKSGSASAAAFHCGSMRHAVMSRSIAPVLSPN